MTHYQDGYLWADCAQKGGVCCPAREIKVRVKFLSDNWRLLHWKCPVCGGPTEKIQFESLENYQRRMKAEAVEYLRVAKRGITAAALIGPEPLTIQILEKSEGHEMNESPRHPGRRSRRNVATSNSRRPG